METIEKHKAIASKLCEEIDKFPEGGGIDSWEELEKLHLLLSTKRLLWKYIEHREDGDSKYSQVIDDICDILEHGDYPMTWRDYMHRPGGHMEIIEMEIGEMEKAYKGMKASPPTVSHKELIREMTHTAAALIYAIEAMTCKR